MATKAQLQAQLDELSTKHKALIAKYNALNNVVADLRHDLKIAREGTAQARTGREGYRALLEQLKMAPKGSKLVGGQLILPGVQ